ncbi:MAG: ATP synthase F1 subunit gamma [Elusimicrobiota bacterium]
MASLREIRRKIKSVRSTQQITRAMKMVSAARMRRAQSAILSSRPFAARLEETVSELALMEAAAAQEGEGVDHPFFERRPDERPGLLLVTGDRGLCGAFNANLLRAAAAWLRARQGKPVAAVLVGRKGRDFVRRLRDAGVETLMELAGIFPKVAFKHAELAGEPLCKRFKDGRLSSVTVIYSEFKSVMVQRVVEEPLLPIPPRKESPTVGSLRAYGFKFEPDRKELLAALLPRSIKAEIYRMLLESQAAELAARMNAMDAATRNAGELMGYMTLELNRTRQALITREIAELVGGAEALAA